MDPIAKACEILSILYLLIYVLGYISLEICIPCEIGKYHFLDSSMLNSFNILSIYVDLDNPSKLLDLSL